MPYGTIAADRITGTNGNSFSPESSVFRNRIINGAMTIDQRNAGASVTVNGGAFYGVDRWKGEDGTDGVFTIQQSSTAPEGFNYSTKITITTADTSLAATQYSYFGQVIEGYNFADLGWGTASAKSVTLSFWVQSSVTGTYTASFINEDQNRCYPATFTISAANTWEQKSITIAGDTTGTWKKTNDSGLKLYICMGTGSTYTGPGNSWAGSLYFNATGSVNLIGTVDATFYITGVQLEAGSTATSFEYRNFGTELAMCQRYYQNTYDLGVAVGTNIADIRNALSAQTPGNNAGQALTLQVVHPVAMRVSPTVAVYDAAGNSNKFTGIASSTAQTNNVAIAGGNLQINSSMKTTSFRSYDIAYYGFGIAATFSSEL
jgi:hypothetical protein